MDFELDPNDIFLIGDAELEEKGLVHHHITSADDLYEIGVPQIITQVFELAFRLDDIRRDSDDEKNIDHIELKVTFSNVKISKPVLLNYNSGKEEIAFPNTCRIKEKTYKASLRIDVKVVANAIMKNGAISTREDTIKNFKICKMPIMVGSKWCNTYGLSDEALTRLHEDPSDPGGYFIINGIEWVVDCVENILFNKVRIFKNEGYKKEMMRAEFISKPGDFYLNSDQFIIRWLNDGQITIEIGRDKLREIYIPFYLIFRIMGWNTDKQIFDNLLYNYDTPEAKKIKQYLTTAFNAKYSNLAGARYIQTQGEVLQYIAEEIAESSFSYLDVNTYKENYQKITNFLLDHMDIHFLQHMGTLPEHRENKMRFLCVLLRKMFLVNLGNMELTDRDSYNSKRIAAAGISCAKTIKTHFNATVIQQVRNKLTKDLRTMSFFNIDFGATIKSSIYGAEFERALTQAIKAGNKSEITVGKKTRINRLSSQLLNRKNQLNTYATLRQVTATSSDSSKQSERANEMRRVHMSFFGYICAIHSPEGEKVGINKQLAIFSFITKASIGAVIKDILLEDKEIMALDTVDYIDIGNNKLCNVYVNGDWIGCCKDALYIAQKYRQKRREFIINPEITIVWDNTQDEVYFWTDAGRVIRPLLIVYNNQRDREFFKAKKYPMSKKFLQGLAVNKKHIDGLYAKKITPEDLLRDGVIEYISAEEQENMFICPTYENLCKERENELLEYTHCDIPQSMFGITALTSPYADHNQTQRIAYQTSQSKQTSGVPTKNWPYRADKDTFLQYNNETPIVKTISNKYLYPNGSNCIVALMCNTGYNQEDSLIINKGCIEKGLFNGCKLTFYKTELEQREEFANPDMTTTMDIKSAYYDKLVNGIIKKGTIVNKNDAIIGKVLKITKSADENYQYVDRSIIYKDDEPAIVHNVIVDRNENDERFAKVILRKLRPVAIGDKFSQIGTSQVLTENGWKEIQFLDIINDKVATLSPEGNLEYVQPSGLSSYHYDGAMYSLKTPDLEIFVTRNHKLYVKSPNNSKFELKRTHEVMRKQVQFKKWANNKTVSLGKKLDDINLYDNWPVEIWQQSMLDSRIILMNLALSDGSVVVDDIYMANNITRLALHAGWSALIKKPHNNSDKIIVKINTENNEPWSDGKSDEYVHYEGMVYCLEIPDTHQHIFYSREHNYAPPIWTGNSSRAGQKGTCGLLLDEADMPRTEEGVAPTILMNPHSIPSRMTVGQLIESHVSNVCAEKCAQIDATIFKKIDIESVALELENLGLQKYGYKRLYNGITGEYIDCEIFMGPTYYQRLQKFTADNEYAAAAGPSDAITMQPLDGGKSSHGGLRIGEMERDVICSHGAMSFMAEKFFDHSDGYKRYVCRCGKAAVVNISKGVYKCNYCKDNADIVAYDTSWSSKLFMQELESMNVGIKQKPGPFTYDNI